MNSDSLTAEVLNEIEQAEILRELDEERREAEEEDFRDREEALHPEWRCPPRE